MILRRRQLLGLAAGALVLVAPGDVHDSAPTGRWHFNTLLFLATAVFNALADVVGRRAKLFTAAFSAGQLTHLVDRMHADIVAGETGLVLDTHVLDLTTELAAALVRRLNSNPHSLPCGFSR